MKVQQEFARRFINSVCDTRLSWQKLRESARNSAWYFCFSEPSDERISEKQSFSSEIELGVQPCCGEQKAISVIFVVIYVHASLLAAKLNVKVR